MSCLKCGSTDLPGGAAPDGCDRCGYAGEPDGGSDGGFGLEPKYLRRGVVLYGAHGCATVRAVVDGFVVMRRHGSTTPFLVNIHDVMTQWHTTPTGSVPGGNAGSAESMHAA